uniref:CRAL-TRIO domain-containing protein n=1 Tax=Acrobeloides nanus TaxID=290746 RepID=A0A914BY38_9BILA
MKALIYDLENMLKKVMEQEAKTGEQTSILFIMDLYGLQYNAQLLEILQGPFPAIVTFMSEHYEEIIQCFLIVNAPLFMSAIWTIVSPFLSTRTKNKVKILGSNWKDEILEMVIPNVLPSSWNIPGQDPIFLANIPSCLPCLPDFYYKGDLLNNTTEVLWVSPGKTGCIDIKVIKNSLLKWTFEADGHFAFAMFFTEDCTERSGSKVIYPVIKKIPGPTYVPLQDSIVSQHAGIYKFWFSNEHAWLHTLKVRYEIDIMTVENG